MRKKLVVFSGAGMSAESGLKTFRDHNGLWENHKVEEVATPEAWRKNPELVLRFYNQRRAQLINAQPNKAHLALAAMENNYDLTIITQNIDDLHERAGSKQVIHLHGELFKVKSEADDSLEYDWRGNLALGDKATDGHQLRPKVVWFGEAVPLMEVAFQEARDADLFIVIGTSLNVYPAASIIHYVDESTPAFLIDPKPNVELGNNWKVIQAKAVRGLEIIQKELELVN